MSVKRCARSGVIMPRRVEPDEGHRPVAGQELAHLRLGLARAGTCRSPSSFRRSGRAEVPVVARAVRLVPVLRLRVVEARGACPCFWQAAASSFRRSRLNGVASTTSKRADLRVVQREAVVVLGRDHDVLHPRVLGELHPGVGVELHGVELLGELLVLGDRDLRAVHDPLADAAGRACPSTRRRGWRRAPSG